MKRLQVSLLAAGILILAFVLTAVGPKRVMAALGYTPVRDVDQPGRQPYVGTFTVNIDAGHQANDSLIAPAVPAGKRLVVDTVTAHALAPSGQRMQIEFATFSVGVSAKCHLPLVFGFTGNGVDFFDGLQSCEMFADPGGQIGVTLVRSGMTGTAAAGGTVSGHLVDLP